LFAPVIKFVHQWPSDALGVEHHSHFDVRRDGPPRQVARAEKGERFRFLLRCRHIHLGVNRLVVADLDPIRCRRESSSLPPDSLPFGSRVTTKVGIRSARIFADTSASVKRQSSIVLMNGAMRHRFLIVASRRNNRRRKYSTVRSVTSRRVGGWRCHLNARLSLAFTGFCCFRAKWFNSNFPAPLLSEPPQVGCYGLVLNRASIFPADFFAHFGLTGGRSSSWSIPSCCVSSTAAGAADSARFAARDCIGVFRAGVPGTPNQLSKDHVDWEIISRVAEATAKPQRCFFLSPQGTSGERIEEKGIKTRLLSPALSSIRWRRGGRIVERLLPLPAIMACLTHHSRFTRRRPNLESLPHKSFAKEEARWPSMGSAASPKTSFAPCWTKPFHATTARLSISD